MQINSTQNDAFKSPSITVPYYLQDTLQTPEGLLKIKNNLIQVFNSFFLSDNFTDRDEMSRADYIMLLDDLHKIVDTSYTSSVEFEAALERQRTLRGLDEVRAKFERGE